MKTRKNYINNKDLYNELCKWRDSAERLEDRIPSEKLGEYFLLIARHMSQGQSWCRYSVQDREDFQMNAVLAMLKNLKNYDFSKTNAFGYFTRACFTSFCTSVQKYYKHKNITRALMDKYLSEMESEFGRRFDINPMGQQDD